MPNQDMSDFTQAAAGAKPAAAFACDAVIEGLCRAGEGSVEDGRAGGNPAKSRHAAEVAAAADGRPREDLTPAADDRIRDDAAHLAGDDGPNAVFGDLDRAVQDPRGEDGVIQCWTVRGCAGLWGPTGNFMELDCPHNVPDRYSPCPATCNYTRCQRPWHRPATSLMDLLDPDVDRMAAIKEECCHCLHFIRRGPRVGVTAAAAAVADGTASGAAAATAPTTTSPNTPAPAPEQEG